MKNSLYTNGYIIDLIPDKHTALIMDNKSMKYEKYFVGKNNMIVNTDKNISRITKVLTIFRSKEIPKNIEEIKYMKTYIINWFEESKYIFKFRIILNGK